MRNLFVPKTRPPTVRRLTTGPDPKPAVQIVRACAPGGAERPNGGPLCRERAEASICGTNRARAVETEKSKPLHPKSERR